MTGAERLRGGLRNEATRVLIVDDEPTIVNFLRTGLRYEGFEIAEAHDGGEALEIAARFHPDVVILDLMMPGMDGYQLCRRLRGNPQMGILMLTAKDEVQDRIHGLDLGADDYLVKPFDFDELLSRIRALLRRLKPTLAEVLVSGPLTLDSHLHKVTFEGRQLDLTAREFDLLKLLMQHPRHVLSRQVILDRVWGLNFYGSDNNVEVYVGYLRSKLGDQGRQLIETVRGMGYRLVV